MNRDAFIDKLNNISRTIGSDRHSRTQKDNITYETKVFVNAEDFGLGLLTDDTYDDEDLVGFFDGQEPFLEISIALDTANLTFYLSVWTACEEGDIDGFEFGYSVSFDGIKIEGQQLTKMDVTEDYNSIQKQVLDLVPNDQYIKSTYFVDILSSLLDHYFDV